VGLSGAALRQLITAFDGSPFQSPNPTASQDDSHRLTHLDRVDVVLHVELAHDTVVDLFARAERGTHEVHEHGRLRMQPRVSPLSGPTLLLLLRLLLLLLLRGCVVGAGGATPTLRARFARPPAQAAQHRA
jgi:hypothetical protein